MITISDLKIEFHWMAIAVVPTVIILSGFVTAFFSRHTQRDPWFYWMVGTVGGLVGGFFLPIVVLIIRHFVRI